MKTKPRGIHASFTTTCPVCRGDITVKDGRPERHDCRERIDLDTIRWPGTEKLRSSNA